MVVLIAQQSALSTSLQTMQVAIRWTNGKLNTGPILRTRGRPHNNVKPILRHLIARDIQLMTSTSSSFKEMKET